MRYSQVAAMIENKAVLLSLIEITGDIFLETASVCF